MEQPNDKLDFSSISFDDVIGEGAEGLETVQTEEPQKAEPLDNELDDDVKEHGDEDYEQYVDEPTTEEESLTVEDDNSSDEELEESLLISDQIADTLGFELEDEYDDTVSGLTSFVKDMSTELAETQIILRMIILIFKWGNTILLYNEQCLESIFKVKVIHLI